MDIQIMSAGGGINFNLDGFTLKYEVYHNQDGVMIRAMRDCLELSKEA